MGLYGMMRTGVSGMSAQANRLSSVADNIANSSTNGYKRAKAEFSSLVLPSSEGSYNSGGVTTSIRYSISDQGPLQYTTSATDLAIEGGGFFVVRDGNGQPFLTRAGSFVPNSQGQLVNAGGYQLMGYSFANGTPTATANGFEGLEPVTISESELVATPSENGILTANLPKGAANAVAGDYSAKTSLVTYDNLGGKKLLDVYFIKTADNSWDVAVYDRETAIPGPDGTINHSAGPLATTSLSFDPTNGKLSGPANITLTVPEGQSLDIDLSAMSQLDTDFKVLEGKVDGNAPSSIESVEISADGTVYAQYGDGSMRALYRVPLADVQSPDRLNVITGNVFSESADSGGVRLAFAGDGSIGKVVAGALENSNVDIAEELTNMIEAQRSYTANSKVFQTGSDLMELLVNLKR